MSQTEKLRALFRALPNKWIPVTQVQTVAGYQYNARIKELRDDPKEPMDIENRTEMVDGARHSWYRWNVKKVEIMFAF